MCVCVIFNCQHTNTDFPLLSFHTVDVPHHLSCSITVFNEAIWLAKLTLIGRCQSNSFEQSFTVLKPPWDSCLDVHFGFETLSWWMFQKIQEEVKKVMNLRWITSLSAKPRQQCWCLVIIHMSYIVLLSGYSKWLYKQSIRCETTTNGIYPLSPNSPDLTVKYCYTQNLHSFNSVIIHIKI